MIPIYRYSINGQRVYPLVSDDFSKNYELETGQQFFRQTVSGNISLIRDDFDWLVSQDFNTEFIFLIEKSNDQGATWSSYFTGKFMFTDCKIDMDQKKATITVDTKDQYDIILSKLDEEYDLIRLGVPTNTICYDKRPLIQIYSPGEDIISCFLGGNYWEQDVNEAVSNRSTLISTYKFAICNAFKEVVITRNSGIPTDLAGRYYGSLHVNGASMEGYLFPVEENGYRVYINMVQKDVDFIAYDNMSISLYDENGVELYRYTTTNDGTYDSQTVTMTAVSGSGATGTIGASVTTKNIFGRYLLDVTETNGGSTLPIPVSDITENVQAYRNVIGYGFDIGYMSRNWSIQPTEWGRVSGQEHQYYDKPTYPEQAYFPIARSTWNDYSFWFVFYYGDAALEKMGRYRYQIKDSFLLSNVISSLLQQIDPTITHSASSEYSQFLYSAVNPISSIAFTLMLTQKSNMTEGVYDQAAQKAPITLGNILTMLKNCFRCYWYVENGKLHIEHIKFFRNGGTYSDDPPVVSADLTTLKNVRLSKEWGFNTQSYYFDKDKMPERYKFSWMDDVTKAFEGYPIIINSPYVQKGNVEDVSVSGFTTDVDYMLLAPDEISSEGFALFACKPAEMLNSYPEYSEYIELVADGGNTEQIPIRQGMGQIDLGLGLFSIRVPILYNIKLKLETFGSADGIGRIEYLIDGSVVAQDEINVSAENTTTILSIQSAPSYGTIRFYSPTNTTFRVYYMTVDNMYELPYWRRTIENLEYNMQNGYLSWISLMQYYLIDLPARYCTVNQEPVELFTTARNKKQVVTFPSVDDPDVQKTIKTSLGYGQIEKLSVNLSTRMNDITLKYDTE